MQEQNAFMERPNVELRLKEKFVKLGPERLKKYEKAGYRIVGGHAHSAVEICRWTKSKLRGERNCFKSAYGIDSSRCIQATATIDLCNFSCKFCWRSFGPERFKANKEWDHPKILVDEFIQAQRELLSGFGGNPATSKEMFKGAMNPVHVALSLDGENTLYPHICELIKEISSRNMTVFLVTNGTLPQKLKEMLDKNAAPTNLYISVYATNEEDYKKVTNSFIPKAFEKAKESLKLFKDFNKTDCRTIFRMTLAKGLNMKDQEGYSKLIRMSQPRFVELKGYSHLGESKLRLGREAMPSMAEIEDFASKISAGTGYITKFRDDVSRVVIMARDEEAWKWNLEMNRKQNAFLKKKI